MDKPAKADHPCPVRGVLDQVGDKWSMLVLVELVDESPLRFSELKRRIDGISQRMLTETLRDLERSGIVQRTIYPTVPPKVEYALEPLGLSLFQVVRPLVAWAKTNRPQIDLARAQFDARR